MGGIVAGIAGGVIGGGLRQIVQGQRPALPNLLLTPSNALRLTNGLSHMRGAALKLGQMLSMDSGIVLSPELTKILAALRDDARPMPPNQLRDVLNAEWGPGWLAQFRKFDVRPFAAASIGQVHRAETRDGRLLAIKVQYPGVRASIDSDVDNIATLMRLPGLLPKGMDITQLLAAAKAQLREEADYLAEAGHLRRFSGLLSGSTDFVLPDLQEDLSTGQVLAMTYLDCQPIETLEAAPQGVRDRAAASLIDLVLRELFTFRAMQTDPNLANYRVEAATGRIVLLDFGAVRPVEPGLATTFRDLLNAALDRDAVAIRAAMLQIGYFGPDTAPHHQDLIQRMFDLAIDPLRQDSAFDFGQSDLLDRLRDMGLALGTERDLMHVPPAETLFLHRKIGGMYLLATRLRARVNLRQLVEPYR
ncbi:MAG: AarF/ABC1/UbiB kinase family protein [Rhodobacteraceae bacterium]|nr:AarF/ABC1/UbiB kinase family protein [Paracoccaceae bacterium]